MGQKYHKLRQEGFCLRQKLMVCRSVKFHEMALEYLGDYLARKFCEILQKAVSPLHQLQRWQLRILD
jgi:hypothetical protein